MHWGHAIKVLERVCACQDPSEQIVLISGKDKCRTPIHRVILIATSKFFTGLLGPNCQKEDKLKEFVFNDADDETIKLIVNFCYTGYIDLTLNNVEKCLTIASSAEIDWLEEECRKFYGTELAVANAVDIFMIADRFRFADLRERAFDLICDEFDMVPMTDIQKLSHPLLQELLKCVKIQGSGDLCAQRLLGWFQCDEDKRSVYMPELLKLIRLGEVTAMYLSVTLEAIFKRFKYSDLVNAEYKRRATDQSFHIGVTPHWQSHNIFRVLVKDRKNEHDLPTDCDEYPDASPFWSTIHIDKYNNKLKGFENLSEFLIRHRRWFEIALHQNRIFALGGNLIRNLNDENSMKSVTSYDLFTNREEEMTEMNVARQNFTSILVGKYIYVFGGYEQTKLLKSCERFDTETNAWEMIASMNVARAFASATILNGYICVAGKHELAQHTSFELYDPQTDEWTQLPSIPENGTVNTVFELSGTLHAMGEKDNVIRKFDPFKNCWKEIGLFDDKDQMKQIEKCINIDGQIFAAMANGKFGRIELGESGKYTFVPLYDSKFTTSVSTCSHRQFLFHA